MPADRDLPRMTHLLVRADPATREGLATAVRDAVRQIDESAAVTVEPLSSALSFAFLPSRLGAALLGVLGVLGTLLAMVGLYGIVSFTVSRRTAEIAIRSTLGASPRAVLLLVVRDAVRLIAVGVIAALGLAWLIVTPLSAFLVAGVSPAAPSTLAAAVVLLGLASVLAIWNPVRRALRVDASAALRLE
jgi:ABC-type antimicrobial peptide transport system permease subunit